MKQLNIKSKNIPLNWLLGGNTKFIIFISGRKRRIQSGKYFSFMDVHLNNFLHKYLKY